MASGRCSASRSRTRRLQPPSPTGQVGEGHVDLPVRVEGPDEGGAIGDLARISWASKAKPPWSRPAATRAMRRKWAQDPGPPNVWARTWRCDAASRTGSNRVAGVLAEAAPALGRLESQHVGRVRHHLGVPDGGDDLVLVDGCDGRVGAEGAQRRKLDGLVTLRQPGPGPQLERRQRHGVHRRRPGETILGVTGQQISGGYPGGAAPVHLQQQRLQVGRRDSLRQDLDQIGHARFSLDPLDRSQGHVVVGAHHAPG